MKAQPPVFQTRDGEGKANQLPTIKGSEPYTAGRLCRNRQCQRSNVSVLEFPYLFFKTKNSFEVGNCVQLADDDLWFEGQLRHHSLGDQYTRREHLVPCRCGSQNGSSRNPGKVL